MTSTNSAEPFVFLDNSQGSGPSYLFEGLIEIAAAHQPRDVAGALQRIETATAGGLYAAGFLTYELGLLFEERLTRQFRPDERLPLLWFGLFKTRRALTALEARALIDGRIQGSYGIRSLRPAIPPEAYAGMLARIHRYIASGDIYQLNFTFKATFDFSGDPMALYADLRRKQKVPYGAVIAAPYFDILSLSPELFLRVEGGMAETRPMKGTAKRGLHAAGDAGLRQWLSADIKSRAENLMIVDLMRNDLGRIAELGSVDVTDLFTVETYQTVLQMTSGVTAKLRDGVGLSQMLKALFPPGSITGAPKLRAMQIIGELEAEPRGVYTGAIGMIGPGGDCVFNVAIRTLVLHRGGQGEIGIGSGIVQDSSAASEYAECLLKMQFLTNPLPDFKLIETLRWNDGSGYYLLDRHLTRLAASAAHFGFNYDEASVQGALASHGASLPSGCHRVRLTLDDSGRIEITSTAMDMPSPSNKLRFAIAERRMNPRNVFVYHKTTRRDFYDGERERLSARANCQEVIFLNERNELTEGSFTNIFLHQGGRLLTPALSSGLLNGTLRQHLIDEGEAGEAILTLRDLADADGIFLGNSVRGLVRAEPVDAFIIEASALKFRRDSAWQQLAART